MSAEQILFWVFAVCTVLGAGVVITSRRPVTCAMALVSTFFFLAGVYVLLWAHAIAVLQVLVYAGAIMVLFLFVIMLLNLGSDAPGGRFVFRFSAAGGVLASVGLLWMLIFAFSRIPDSEPLSGPSALSMGTLKALGGILYTQYLLPFEVVSLLLLVAIVGAVVVAKPRI